MTKTQLTKIILISVSITLFLDIFLGRYFIAKISTLPVLNKLKILSPQAPIVINNRETIRVSDSGDAISAVNSIKSKLSSVVYLDENNSLVFVGNAVNLTSDGVFLTSISTFSKEGKKYYVLLNDGRSALVETIVSDPATNLVFVKTNLANVSIVNFADPRELKVGEKILLVKNSLKKYASEVVLDIVNRDLANTTSQVYLSDYPKINFGVKDGLSLVNGEVVANTNGEVVSIWNGNYFINSNNIKKLMSLYYASPQKIIRPSLGFSYSLVTNSESALSGTPVGALVKEVTGANSKLAGLQLGDVILKVNSKEVDEDGNIEMMLQEFKPNEKIEFVISRKNQIINLNIIISELKGV